jgi:serine protease Do
VKIVGATDVGKVVAVIVVRDGKEIMISVTVGHREQVEAELAENNIEMNSPTEPKQAEVSGMIVIALTKAWREKLGLTEGLEGVIVSSVDDDSPASKKGIAAGDIIVEAGQKQVKSVAEFNNRVNLAIDSGKSAILLLLRRDGNQRFLALPIK